MTLLADHSPVRNSAVYIMQRCEWNVTCTCGELIVITDADLIARDSIDAAIMADFLKHYDQVKASEDAMTQTQNLIYEDTVSGELRLVLEHFYPSGMPTDAMDQMRADARSELLRFGSNLGYAFLDTDPYFDHDAISRTMGEWKLVVSWPVAKTDRTASLAPAAGSNAQIPAVVAEQEEQLAPPAE